MPATNQKCSTDGQAPWDVLRNFCHTVIRRENDSLCRAMQEYAQALRAEQRRSHAA